MPVVLVEVGGVARSGHLYGDRTGVEYEYPSGRYESWIQPGERFVYQKPGKGYIGCGVVGEIRGSHQPGRLICDVLSVRLFEKPVSLKDAVGTYYEADTSYWKDKVYWGQGVRPLTDARFDAIVAAAGASPAPCPDPAPSTYADPSTARAVEDYSVAAAVDAMAERFGQQPVVMPRNNPGFDLRVGPEECPIRYVEVKGTQTAGPVFFMSEGERQFSIRNSALYTLVVVSGIDLATASHGSISVRDGAVAGKDVELRPTQWRGQLVDD